MKNVQQSQNLLPKVGPLSTSCNNFIYLAKTVSLRDKLNARWKTRNVDPKLNLQRNNAMRQVEGFCISYFTALMAGVDLEFM